MTLQALDNQTFAYLFLWPILPSNPVIPGPLHMLIFFFFFFLGKLIVIPFPFPIFSKPFLTLYYHLGH